MLRIQEHQSVNDKIHSVRNIEGTSTLSHTNTTTSTPVSATVLDFLSVHFSYRSCALSVVFWCGSLVRARLLPYQTT